MYCEIPILVQRLDNEHKPTTTKIKRSADITERKITKKKTKKNKPTEHITILFRFPIVFFFSLSTFQLVLKAGELLIVW